MDEHARGLADVRMAITSLEQRMDRGFEAIDRRFESIDPGAQVSTLAASWPCSHGRDASRFSRLSVVNYGPRETHLGFGAPDAQKPAPAARAVVCPFAYSRSSEKRVK